MVFGSAIKPANIVNRASALVTNMACLPALNRLSGRLTAAAILANRSAASNGLNQPSYGRPRVALADAWGSSDARFASTVGKKPTESRQREECPSERTSSRFGLAISGRLPCPPWHRPVQPPRRARSAETEAARRKVHDHADGGVRQDEGGR